jgi:hypothetical protein
MPPQREVRVFVSSTFQDMLAEREELVKHVFPQLRRLCENRGVTWGEVDLRWGVTDEASSEGRVLPLCLAEIDRCRPYFIGILGERYGWVPHSIPEQLYDTYPWIREYRQHSVVELEFLYGALLSPDRAEGAYFYFRAPPVGSGSARIEGGLWATREARRAQTQGPHQRFAVGGELQRFSATG